MELEKTLKMNILFSFYGPLLTDKQAAYMAEYYEEDYTLAEIADNHNVSRQAIYDSIKRAEESLIEYERKLQLVWEFDKRSEALINIQKYVQDKYPNDTKLKELLKQIVQDTTREEN
jgi:hypothetical protein